MLWHRVTKKEDDGEVWVWVPHTLEVEKPLGQSRMSTELAMHSVASALEPEQCPWRVVYGGGGILQLVLRCSGCGCNHGGRMSVRKEQTADCSIAL